MKYLLPLLVIVASLSSCKDPFEVVAYKAVYVSKSGKAMVINQATDNRMTFVQNGEAWFWTANVSMDTPAALINATK